MVRDEVQKKHLDRLADVITMSDALILDIVSAFTFPYLIVDSGRRVFLFSREWQRFIQTLVAWSQCRLWDLPIELSVRALQDVLRRLCEKQPNLRVIFHLPRPCFNDGVSFDDPEVTRNVQYYRRYGEKLYDTARLTVPNVGIVSCGGELADPLHYNGPHPFHFAGSYMEALRRNIERLLE